MISRIRAAINGNRDLQHGLSPLDQQHGTKVKKVIAEALKSKDVGDGCNVVMHAAMLGRDCSFKSAVVVVKQRLGRGGFITPFRESDFKGAPLSFHAAGGLSAACFEFVCKVLHKTLGRNELRQQVQVFWDLEILGGNSPLAPPTLLLHNPTAGTCQAIDLKERSIIFRPAKSQVANVFQAVIQAFDGDGGGCPRNTDNGDQTEAPRTSWLLADDLPESPAPEDK
ncbi:unnamed protein product [Ectocarpus sp. CCAP 1310/34]|nr:unnamed protein product [Ectocarpus sp. CCAP 1310/34]